MTENADIVALARQALELLKEGAFKVGPPWETAHEICQGFEGVEIHDRIHAFCHRIEGDHGNAGYWDRRGNQKTPTGDFQAEWQGLINSL